MPKPSVSLPALVLSTLGLGAGSLHAQQVPSGPADTGAGLQPSKTITSSGIKSRWRPSERPDDADSDGVLDVQDDCPSTAAFVTVNSEGCGLFDAVLDKVTFSRGSLWLNDAAREQLISIADTLLAFPESRVQIRAHTDSIGTARYNLALSTRRAEVVAKFLLSQGVGENQLSTRGMGESEPLYNNETEEGQLQNRRIDLVTLPDIDARALPSTEAVTEHQFSLASELPSSQLMTAEDALTDAELPSRPVLAAALATEVDPETPLPPITASSSVPILDPIPFGGVIPGFGMTGLLKDVGFTPGADNLTGNAREALKRLVKALERNPSISIAVMAHTDDRGSSEENLALSIARANAVVEHLSEAGIERDRLVAEGYGEQLPIVQNVTAEDRARNRRVDIRVISD